MQHQPLETQKYLVDRSRDPLLRRLNRKRWTPWQVRRFLVKIVLVVGLMLGGVFLICGDDSSGGYQDGRWMKFVQAIKAMVGELNQTDRVMNSI
ncbi:MAG: hypothetical protein AAF802_26960 [Planctomycetota bacterium]